MSNPSTNLGLSCPSEGKFYVCNNAKIRFIGCCTVDPCANGSGLCPQLNLRTSSFSSDHYNEIGVQSCVDADPAKSWFTCQSSPPFIGCCKSDPCKPTGCPTSDLIAARLSDDATSAQVLIGTASATTTSISTSSPTSTPTTTASPDTGAHLSTGAIIGISVGGAAVIFILLGILAYKCGWWARHRKAEQEAEKGPRSADASQFAYSPVSPGFPQSYQDSRHSAISSAHLGSATLPGYHTYYPSQSYDSPSASPPPVNVSSLAASDVWKHDPRHASQMSSVTWDSISTAIAQKQHPISMELDGDETQRPRVISELPAANR